MNKYLSLIKFSHTIFAFPFAILGFVLGYLIMPDINLVKVLSLVALAMVFARSAAMAFNRYLDRDIDGKNPRTVTREIPAGEISPQAALWFVILNSLAFVVVTYFINTLCFVLSPVALLVVLGYSYTKRFTFLCHFVLGAGLGLAPLGAYLATGNGFDIVPLVYAFAVFFWVSGFDIIYALQDDEFDRSLALKSVPAVFGRNKALMISRGAHICSALLIVAGGYLLQQEYSQFGWMTWLATGFFVLMLVYQHSLVKPNDLSKVGLAFFTTNGIASLCFGSLVVIDALI